MYVLIQTFTFFIIHRLQDLQKIDEEPKPVIGRIADKISLFERPAGGINKQIFQTPRSADVSPVRKATERLESNVLLSDQRSRSAERYGEARSSSVSPVREKPMTIKERARNFTEGSKTEHRAALPHKPATTGMSQKSTLCVAAAASKSPELDNQGKLDTKEQIQTNATSEITLKPDGRDTTAVGAQIYIPKGQPTDSQTKHTLALKAADQAMKPNSAETKIPAKEPGDSAEPINSISPQSKVPNRAGSRSKRRKSREPTSPLSPNSENKPDCSTSKPEVTALKQGQVDDTEESASASKQLKEKVSLPSDKAQGNTSDKQSDTKQKAFKKELKVLDKQKKPLDSSFKKVNIDKPVNRQEGLPEPSINKDEPDTAASSSETKTPIDKDSVILAQKEDVAGGHSLLFTEERETASKDSREPSASPAERLIEKTPSREQEPPVERPKLDKDLSVQSEQKSKVKVRKPNKKDIEQTQQPQNKSTELINQAESKDVEKLEKVESDKTNDTENKDKQKPQELLSSDTNTTKAKVSDNGQGISGTEGSVVRADERKNAERKEKTRPVKEITRPETNQPEPASESSEKTGTTSSSDLRSQTQHVRETITTHPQKAAVCAVTHTKEAVSGTEGHKGPSKGETATNVPTELQTKSTESPGTETQPVVTKAEPQPESVSVEKEKNSPDDSCTHGANGAEVSSLKPITKATTAVEEVTVKAANDNPPPITAQADNMAEKKSSVKEPTPISVSKSVSSEGAGQDDGEKSTTVKSVPSEVQISGDIMKPTPRRPQCKESKNTESGITSLKGAENKAQTPSDRTASSSTVNVAEKAAGKTFHSAMNELSPVVNGDISPHPQLSTVKKEPVNKLSPTLKAPTFPEANKMTPDLIQHSSMKKLHLPRGLSKDDSATRQDAPSSWLDVDFPKRKLKVPVRKLSSSGSESNLLDTSGELDDDDFVEKIKKLCAPFSLPPRKHSLLRPSQPPFAMPAIKEDRFEKTFDPEEFKFGLRKKNKFTVDTAPSHLARLQNKETKSGLKPARASLADRSILLGSLDTHSRLRDKTKEEEDVKEEKDDQIKVKSRLEGSCVFSSLASSSFRGKRNGVQTQAEGTSSPESGGESPSEAPQLSPPPLSQPPPPSPTATAPLRDTLAKQSPAQSNREEAPAAEAVASDSGPPLPSFNDIKLPDYLEKYLPREPAKPVQSLQGQEQVKTEVSFSVCYCQQLKNDVNVEEVVLITQSSQTKYLLQALTS